MSIASNPPRLTPLIHAKIVESALLGMPLKSLALRVKLSPQTFYEWMKRGEEDCKNWEDGLNTSSCQRLFEDVMSAYGEFLFIRYKKLNVLADEGNQAAIRYLFEKSLPEIFGENNKTIVEHTGSVENVYTIDIPEERKTKLIDMAIKKITDKKMLKDGN